MIDVGEYISLKTNFYNYHYVVKVSKITREGIEGLFLSVDQPKDIIYDGLFFFHEIEWIREATEKEIKLAKGE